MSQEKTSVVSVSGTEAERVYDEPIDMAPEEKPVEVWGSRSKQNVTIKSGFLLPTTFIILSCFAISIAVIALCVSIIFALKDCNCTHEPTAMPQDSSFQDLQRQLNKTVERLASVEKENVMLNEKVISIETHAQSNRYAELENRVATLEEDINTAVKNNSCICTQPEYRVNFTAIVENHTSAFFGNLSQIEGELLMLHIQVNKVTAATELLAASHNTTINSLSAIQQGILDFPLSIEALNATVSELSTLKASQKDFDHLFSSFKNLSTTVGILKVTTVSRDDFSSLSSSVHDLANAMVNHTEFSALLTNFRNLVSDFTAFSSATQNEFRNFSSVVGTIDVEVQHLSTTTVNMTDFKMLTADVRSLAASSVNLTDFNILSANVSSVDAETKRLAENKASQDDFNLLFSSVTVLNATKASQTELDYLLSDVSLMRVTLQQLSISAVNKTEFHQLTATVSYNVSMINATLQQLKDTTVNQIDFQQLSNKVTGLHTSKANGTDLSLLSDEVSRLNTTSVNKTEFSHYADLLQSLTVTAVSKVDFDRLSTRVDSLTNTAVSRTEFSRLDNRVKSIETTVSQSGSLQALANPRVFLLISLFVSYAVFQV